MERILNANLLNLWITDAKTFAVPNLNFLREFLDKTVDNYQAIGYIEALATTQRNAISERRSITEWSAYEFYISEWQ